MHGESSPVRVFVSDKNEPIVEVEAGAEGLMQWFSANIDSLMSEPIPFYLPEGGSIAEKVANFYEEYEPDCQEDNLLDALYAYRERHDIRFALRGYDVPSVLIGKHEGQMEISRSDELESWSFYFDANDLHEIVAALQSSKDVNSKSVR